MKITKNYDSIEEMEHKERQLKASGFDQIQNSPGVEPQQGQYIKYVGGKDPREFNDEVAFKLTWCE